MRCLRITFLLWIVSFSFSYAKKGVENGLLVLSQGEMETPVMLNGKWLFYWNIPFAQYRSENFTGIPEALDVPGNWGMLSHPGHGFGTYVLHVVLPQSNYSPIGLRVPSVGNAYRLYVDGDYVGKAGKFATNATESQPEYFPQEIYFTPTKDTLEIAFEVSNYHYREGGLSYTPSLGTADSIKQKANKSLIISSFVIGLLILVLVYFGAFYLLNPKDTKALYFTLLCLSAALRQSSVTEQIVLKQYFPDIPWEWLVRCEYISLFGIMSFSVLYFSHLFEEDKNKYINIATSIISSSCSLFILFTPARISSYIIPPFLLYALCILCYLLYMSVRAVVHKRKFARWFLLGYMSIFICGINDILTSQEIIISSYMLPAGIISFVFINVVMLTSIFSDAFHNIEHLSFQLEEVNRNQKRIIFERTIKLSEKTWELEKINDVKDKIFSIIAHDLRSPIKTLGAFLSLAVSEVGLTTLELKTHLKKIQRDTESLNLTLENLLMWSRSQIHEVNTTPVDLEVSQVVDLCLDLYRLPAENKGIKLFTQVPEGLYIHVDKDHLSLILRNVIGNALKFSREGDQVTVSSSIHDHYVQILVRDTGIGIPEEQLAKMFLLDEHHTTQGTTNERGTGLGLLLCKEYIEENKGTIRVESAVGKGTLVCIELPATKELFD